MKLTVSERSGERTATHRTPGEPGSLLTAQWLDLLLLNFVVDPHLLTPHVPAGTELDLWQSEAVVSVVGFRVCHRALLGLHAAARWQHRRVRGRASGLARLAASAPEGRRSVIMVVLE